MSLNMSRHRILADLALWITALALVDLSLWAIAAPWWLLLTGSLVVTFAVGYLLIGRSTLQVLERQGRRRW